MIRAGIAAIMLLIATIARAQQPGGIKSCIDSSIQDGKLHLTHVLEITGDVVGRDEWVIRCVGLAALAAWDQFYSLRGQDDPVEQVGPNAARALVMKTGTGSRCIKLTKNPDGSPAEKAVCDISLDLAPGFYQGALGQ